MTAIESADVAEMVDSNSDSLLTEIREKRAKLWYWPFAAVGTCALGVMAYGSGSTALLLLALGLGSFGTSVAYVWDRMRKTVVLLYDFEPDLEVNFRRLIETGTALASCSRIWHLAATAKVLDQKYHAGAGYIAQRNRTSIRLGAPRSMKCNIDPLSIGVGRQRLFFFPDRVLIVDGRSVGEIAYADLRLEVSSTSFNEHNGPPPDGKVVGRTWLYVNKNNGPDKRFRNNRQIAVCSYEKLAFKSRNGLNEIIMLSRVGLGAAFANAVRELSGPQTENSAIAGRLPTPSRTPPTTVDTPVAVPVAQLWLGTTTGMTVAQVKAKVPQVQAPIKSDHLASGAVALLELNDILMVGQPFRASFYFHRAKLQQVFLSPMDCADMNKVRDLALALESNLTAECETPPERQVNPNGSVSLKWTVGLTSIGLHVVVLRSISRCMLNLIIKARDDTS